MGYGTEQRFDDNTKSTEEQTLEKKNILRTVVAFPTLLHGAFLICRRHYLAPFHVHVDVQLATLHLLSAFSLVSFAPPSASLGMRRNNHSRVIQPEQVWSPSLGSSCSGEIAPGFPLGIFHIGFK